MNRKALLAVSTVAAVLVATPALATSTRTYVSNGGSDANATFSCDFAHPCRTFAAALAQTTAGGEILAIDSSGYGRLVIDRSVSILAAPGAYAGIGVGAAGNATGIEIATAGVDVVLRGLTLTGQGGNFGIGMTAGNSLFVENCVISDFAGGAGIMAGGSAWVRVIDSVIRRNGTGAAFTGGAHVLVSGSRFLNNSGNGVEASSDSVDMTRLSVERSVASGNGGVGFLASSKDTGAAQMAIVDSVAEGNGTGVLAEVQNTGSVEASVADSLVAANGNGIMVSGAGAKMVVGGNAVTKNGLGLGQASAGQLRSDGTNSVNDNTTETSGTVSTFGRM